MSHEEAEKRVEAIHSTQQPLWKYTDIIKDVERCANLLGVKPTLLNEAIICVSEKTNTKGTEFALFFQNMLLTLEYIHVAKEEEH